VDLKMGTRGAKDVLITFMGRMGWAFEKISVRVERIFLVILGLR
jgi:hypothetical protein